MAVSRRLTQTERADWNRRISARIEKRIAELKLSCPKFDERMNDKARELALEHLDITDLYNEYEEAELAVETAGDELQERINKLQEDIQALEDEQQDLLQATGAAQDAAQFKLLAKLHDMSHKQFKEAKKRLPWNETNMSYVKTRINEAASALRERAMADDKLGKEILRLEQEQDSVGAAVLLTTSPTELRDLWTGLNSVLETENSALQQIATKSPSCSANVHETQRLCEDVEVKSKKKK